MPTILTLTSSTSLPTQEISVPSSWADVLLVEYLAILGGTDGISTEQRLTGLKPEDLELLNEGDRHRLLQRLDFVLDTQQLEEKLPTPGLYEVAHCSYRLFEQAHQHLAGMPDAPAIEQGAVLYAYYRDPKGYRAEVVDIAATYHTLLNRPVTEVYADCLHFLRSYHRAAQGQPSPDGPRQPGLLRLEPAPPATPLGTTLPLGRRLLNSLVIR